MLTLVAVVLVIVSNPQKSRSSCTGLSRVEALSDIDRREVGSVQVPIGVGRLRRLHQPTGDTEYRRAIPVETTTYMVRARLLGMKREPNRDINLTVSPPNGRTKTMIVTFPSSRCGARASKTRRAEMRRAASRLIAACGEPTGRKARLSGIAEIAGIGLFGRGIGSGAAPNGIKLAPVLHFKGVRCHRPKPAAGNPSRTTADLP
jgi:hypothetical protein